MIDRILLFPYYLTLKMRDSRWKRRAGKLYVPEVPSICVGNITAGGTGKTPHVEMILRLLQESPEWSGKNIAVLSRGYKRESKGFQQVVAEGSASAFGDEPLQIKKKFPGVTVAVDKDRVEGCELLCHPERLKNKKSQKNCWNREFPAADYIVLDDAFQYRKLKPARTILLVDWNRPVQKDMLLPLGRLRDLKERQAEADVIIVTKAPRSLEREEKAQFVKNMGLSDYDPETCLATESNGHKQMVLFSYIKYGQATGVYKTTDQRYVYSKKIIMVTGIAKDTPLRRYLSDFYKIVSRFRFPDHHKYTWSDINRIQNALKDNPTAAIMTTEKDAQRMLDFNGMPQDLMVRMFMVPIEMDFLSETEKKSFNEFITGF